jgi:hypothetical protein
VKFLVWSAGAIEILAGLMLAWSVAPAWKWVWLALAVLWFFAGVTIGLVALAKLVTGKVGAGALRSRLGAVSGAPAPHKEE